MPPAKSLPTSPVLPETLNVSVIPGVGPIHVDLLASLGLHTVHDLLHYAPKRHEDRRHLKPLTEAEENEPITVRGRIHATRSMRWHSRRVFEIVIAPEELKSSKEVVKARWFGRYDLEKRLLQGTDLFLFGRLKRERTGWLMNPTEFEIVENDADSSIHIDRLTPIYPLTQGLYARVMRRFMFEATQRLPLLIPEPYPVPQHFMTRLEAFRAFHFPETRAIAEAARHRLAYDEFMLVQCVVARRRAQIVHVTKQRPARTLALVKPWLESMPFQPTGAQARVMKEVACDLDSPHPMNRLLQGDVGSGKTMIAVHAMLSAAERGEQSALMAPTQILAEQHALNLRRWLEPLGIEVHLFTGNQKPSSRLQRIQNNSGPELFAAEAYQKASKGSVSVGTHALLFDRFQAQNLGLIVIDEQHKFGVLQRLALSQKGNNPDILVMTATPIPRTLGLTLYGDLDCSTLDELPPGRQPIKTVRRSSKQLTEFWKFLKSQLAQGRQAYVIYPLVEESDKVDAKSVKAEHERLRHLLPDINIGLLHGQLSPQEKERVMDDFRNNRLHILVSTSVIEVGVDVPNANIMLIENAERFGLAQLHQLRGRIGRGQHASYCVLVGEPKSEEGWRRLKIMEETSDGFLIAEEDMDIRGEGNILGTQQSGLPPLHFGRLKADFHLFTQARDQIQAMVKQDPSLKTWPLLHQSIANHAGTQFVAVS